jgi:hypothetical protein
MSQFKSKVRVSTDALLESVKERRVADIARYEHELVTYENRRARFQMKVVSALEKATENAKKGKVPETGWRSLEVPFPQDRPEKPYLNTASIDRLIKTLEMAADETILISADDAAAYLG